MLVPIRSNAQVRTLMSRARDEATAKLHDNLDRLKETEAALEVVVLEADAALAHESDASEFVRVLRSKITYTVQLPVHWESANLLPFPHVISTLPFVVYHS